MKTKELAKVKNILYEIMTTETSSNKQSESKDIVANQQMGVKLSNSVKKEGVNIYQLQNVVSNQIVGQVVDALKIIDSLQEEKHLPIDGSAIQMVIEWLASQELTLNEFMNGMKKAYIEEVINQCDTKSEAAKKLDIQRTYLSRITKSLGIDDDAAKIEQLTSAQDVDDVLDAEFEETK